MLRDLLGLARKTALRPIKHLINLADPPVIVLIYHRVTTLSSDPEMLAVTPENFRAQVRYLKDTVPVVRFEDDWSKASRPAVAITFDDGYADNMLEALPILEEEGVPATFFISTGSIGTTREFWWHELERIILKKQNLPSSFTLKSDRLVRNWQTDDLGQRLEFYQGIMRVMNDADFEHRNDLLVQLRCWAQTGEEAADMHRAMSIDELRLLAASSLVTIGAHTVSHSRLTRLSPERQQEEMGDSKRQLERWLGREISLFSYPFGKRSDYSRESVKLCRQTGFTRAAANFPGQVHRWTDPYQVPRHLVRNWPLESFTEMFREFWTR